jgi:hypothetical protein
MCRSHHAVKTRLHEGRKARKKLQKDMKEVKIALYQTRLLPLRASRKERATLLLHLSKDKKIMRTLIPCIHLLPMLAPLTWGLTLSLVATLVSKVPLLMHLLLHLLQSSRDLAWPIKSQLISLVPHTPVWLVVPTRLFIILLCHHSLTPPYTPGPRPHWAPPHDYAPLDN